MQNLTKPVAIVGLSLRYPGFCGPAAFFESCRTAHSRLRRADIEAVRPYLLDGPQDVRNPYRINNDLYGSIRDMSWIDARHFRVPPNDIEGDPSPFICLQVASEALVDYQAGRGDECIPRKRTGVVIGRGDHPHRGLWAGLQGGMGFELIRELLLERPDLFTKAQVDSLVDGLVQRMKPSASAPSLAANLVSNVISGMVANRLDLQGPNFLVDAACTSAIVAIQQAVHSLYADESDLMLVGASQATMEVPIIQMFSWIGAIAKHDAQPFNSLVEGTLLSEGVGFVALKRLDDARRDGDRIYAVVRGMGLASDGNDTSILAPSSRGQILAMRNTYDALDGIYPDDIGYLEAHATGINLGDQTELDSIHAVFTPHKRSRPLVLGALKSLIGHSIPASGMAALIRATYAVAYGIYPVSRCDTPTERINSLHSGLFLPSCLSPWYERPSVPRRAAINCFGFGGINGHLVLEQNMITSEHKLLNISGVLPYPSHVQSKTGSSLVEPTQVRARVSTGCPVYLICLSFNDTQDLLTVLSQALEAIIEIRTSHRTCRSFSSSVPGPGTYRIGFVDHDLGAIQSQLELLYAQPDLHHKYSKKVPEKPPELAVMLPGEALIPFGYLSELAVFIPSVKSLLEFVDASSTDGSILGDTLHPSWTSLLSDQDVRDLESAANHHDCATKALFVVSIAYFGILRTLGINPSAFVGHSTGEINALMLAGGLQCRNASDVQGVLRSFEKIYADASYLDHVPQGVVVLCAGLSDEKLFQCLHTEEDIYLVSDNSPSHRLVFSRHRTSEQLGALIAEYGGFILPTQLDRAYHTPLFTSGAELMRNSYQALPLVPVRNRVYSCCSTEPYPESAEEQVDLLIQQWRDPVRFREVLLNMYRDGYRCFLELNARRVLIGFAESTFHEYDDVSLLSTGTAKEHGAVGALANSIVSLWLQGCEVHWDAWNELFLFPDDQSLPSIERPARAITILHDLHRFTSADYNQAWADSTPDDPANDVAAVDHLYTHPISAPAPAVDPASPSSSVPSSEVLSQHQSTMRRALESIERNTLITIQRMS